MGIFYTLHHILPSATNKEYGKRNTRVFMIGAIIYIILYAILRHTQLIPKFTKSFDILNTCFILLFIADVASVSYLYKSFFGRTIISEIGTKNNKKWLYDKEKHTYKVKSVNDIKLENKIDDINFDNKLKNIIENTENIIENEKKIKNKKEILENKNKIKATKTIQKWWRKKNNNIYIESPPAYIE